MASNWNVLMEGMSRAKLRQQETSVLTAIARRTLGFQKESDRIAITQLVTATGLDRRHVSRTLDQLEARNIIRRTGGAAGRMNTATIGINLNIPDWIEKSPREETMKSRPAGRQTSPEMSPHGEREMSPHGADTRGKNKGRALPPLPPQAPGSSTTAAADQPSIEDLAVRAYVANGGSVELTDWHEALTRNARLLATRNVDTRTILEAASQLGREHSFPGYLIRRAKTIADQGGPCTWQGLDRMALTIPQLAECRCNRCREWHDHRTKEPLTA
jgi:phage replication O-like protein O